MGQEAMSLVELNQQAAWISAAQTPCHITFPSIWLEGENSLARVYLNSQFETQSVHHPRDVKE